MHMMVGREICFGKRVPLVVYKKVGFPADHHVHRILPHLKDDTFEKYQKFKFLKFTILLINMIY
jgi:hypothetical protein